MCAVGFSRAGSDSSWSSPSTVGEGQDATTQTIPVWVSVIYKIYFLAIDVNNRIAAVYKTKLLKLCIDHYVLQKSTCKAKWWCAIQQFFFVFVCIFSLWRTTGFGGSEITLWCPVTPCSWMSSGEVCHQRSTPSMRTARANLCSSKVRLLHIRSTSLSAVCVELSSEIVREQREDETSPCFYRGQLL